MDATHYRDRTFVVADPNAWLRAVDLTPLVYQAGEPLPPGAVVGGVKKVPKGTKVKVTDAKVADGNRIFVEVAPEAGGLPGGWTVAWNLEGRFLNEVIGYTPAGWEIEPTDPSAFTVVDAQALVRGGAPSFFPTGRTIPQRRYVKVLERSADGRFARVAAATVADGALTAGEEIGWTAASNLLPGCSKAYFGWPWQDQRGAFGCWDHGRFLGPQVIVAFTGLDKNTPYTVRERLTLGSLGPYLRLVRAAQADGAEVGLNSGFRTYPEQALLYDRYRAGVGAKAAKPGTSNHQSGRAVDLNAWDFNGTVYTWLKGHAPRHGFIRTVSDEPWHWEYLPQEAGALAAQGLHKRSGVSP